MTPLERLKELNEKATRSPWMAHNAGIHWNNPDLINWEIRWNADGECVADTVYGEADAHLIAATRNLLPELIALWEAVGESFDPEYGLHDIESVGNAMNALDARADEVLK